MSCCKDQCTSAIEFDIDGGVCIPHYVEWSLRDSGYVGADYKREYDAAIKEVTTHVRLMDGMDDFRSMLQSGRLTQVFEDEPFVEALALAVKLYDAKFVPGVKEKSGLPAS